VGQIFEADERVIQPRSLLAKIRNDLPKIHDPLLG
jgi:hypothetical protein